MLKKIIILGGGMVGSAIARDLKELDYSVTVADIDESIQKHLAQYKINYLKLDVADFNSLINEGGIAYEPDSEEPFDGKAASYYPNGRLMYEAEYKDGKQHGKIISFYENGSKESEGAMENGVFHGNFIHYYPNGQKQSQYNYRNGNAISRDNWDETGKVVARGK